MHITGSHEYLLTTVGYTEVTTGPSAILSGHTFYTGNVYLSLPTVVAEDITCQECYCSTALESLTDVILTMASADLRSFREDDTPWGLPEWPVNYADFNAPNPWR